MIALLGLAGVVIAASVGVVQFSRGRLFTLLTFHSVLFILECGGGAVKALLPNVFSDFASPTAENPLPLVPRGLVVYIAGYVLMLYGYAIATALTRRTTVTSSEAMDRFFDKRWTPSYRLLLLLATVAALAFGFIQHYYRIRSAGGLSAFLATAYQHRFGTATETQADTAIVVASTVVASTALALVLIWIFAWLRGRLGPGWKVVVAALVAVLLVRQYTSMFRAVILLTLVTLFAAYISERRITTARAVLIGGLLGGAFVAVNFVHLYLYYLTAGWEAQGLAGSLAQFLAPHGHLYTLSAVLAKTGEGAAPLAGKGLLESVLFFIPRGVWAAKLPSDQYGTILVQAWADLPTHYQMAITPVGEWIAHFGYPGMALMVLNGALIGWLDSFYDRGTILRAALFGILLGRVLPDAGMGLSSISITLVLVGAFLGVMAALDFILAFLRWLFRAGTPDRGEPLSVPRRRAPVLGGVDGR